MAKKQTYADRAKSIMNEYKLRLGDKFDKGDAPSLKVMNQRLTALQQEQEAERERMQQEQAQFQENTIQTFRDGGKLTKKQHGLLSGILAERGRGTLPLAKCGGKLKMATGGSLPKYQGPGENPNFIGQRPWTMQDYMRSAQTANQGFNQIPYGQQAYPYGQYFGDTMLDNFGQIGNVGTGQFQGFRTPNPNDLIAGRSPLDPLQRGAGAVPYTQNPVMMNQAGRFASPGLGTLQDIANQGYTVGTTRDDQRHPYAPATAGGTAVSNTPTSPSSKPAQQAATTGPNPIGAADIRRPQGGLGFQQLLDTGYRPPGAVPDTIPGAGIPTQGADVATGQVPAQREMFQSRVPWWGAAAQGLGSILANRQIDFGEPLEGVEDLTAQQIAARQVDYSRSREQIQRERDRAQGQIRRAARGRGTAQGLTGATIGGATETQRVAGQQFTQSQEAEANRNAQIKNQVAMFNAQQRAQTGQINLRTAMMRDQIARENQLINVSRRGEQIAGGLGALTQYGKDRLSAQQYDQMINMGIADKDYGFVQQDPTFLRRLLGVTDPASVQFYNPNARVS